MRIIIHNLLHELRSIFGNTGTLMVLGFAALIYGFFYPLPYQPQVAQNLPVVVVDGDRSAMSRQLTRFADATPEVAIYKTVYSEFEAEQELAAGNALGVLVIPNNFERDILRSERVVVGIYGDASYFLAYSQIASGLATATGTLSAGVEIRRMQASGYTEAAAYARRDPLPVHISPLYNETSGYGHYVVPAVLILILQQTLLVGIGMLSGSRRENRTLGFVSKSDQPSLPRRAGRNLQVLIGRSLAYLGIYAIHVAVYLFVIYRVFDFPQRGQLGQIYLFLLPFVLATTFLGTAIATLFRERESSIQILLFSSMPAIFISGFAWPVEAIPMWIQRVSLALPSTSAIDGYIRLNHLGASFYQVKSAWFALWVLAGVYLVIALFAAAFGPKGETRTERSLLPTVVGSNPASAASASNNVEAKSDPPATQ